jgi:hypothetical protein
LDGWPEVTRWLTPAMHRVGDATAMRSVLHAWREAQPNLPTPRGRWSVQRRDDDTIVGGLGHPAAPAVRRPRAEPVAEARRVGPGLHHRSGPRLSRGRSRATSRSWALARPNNVRAIATAEWVGMEWVGETEKYYGLRLQVYSIRHGDIAG